jgi:hypothetical protein
LATFYVTICNHSSDIISASINPASRKTKLIRTKALHLQSQ